VLEEALLKPVKEKVRYLDGLVRALDRAAEAKMPIALIAPAQRLLGLEWVAPFLVRPVKAISAPKVFVDRKVRNLLPFDWWQDPGLLQKRIALFRELAGAVSGHPAVTAWFLFDRFLEWSTPEAQQADWLLKAFLAELKERNNQAQTFLNLDWSALLDPDPIKTLVDQVHGICLTGFDFWPQDLEPPAHEFLHGAFLGLLGQWIFKTSVELEIGWTLLGHAYDPQALMESGSLLARQGVNGLNWLTLADPTAGLHLDPPWNLNPDLANLGLLDQALDPKTEWNAWFKQWSSQKAGQNPFDFIDINVTAYLSDPKTHFNRLWEHFIDSQ